MLLTLDRCNTLDGQNCHTEVKHGQLLTALHSACRPSAPGHTVLESYLAGQWQIVPYTSLDPVQSQTEPIKKTLKNYRPPPRLCKISFSLPKIVFKMAINYTTVQILNTAGLKAPITGKAYNNTLSPVSYTHLTLPTKRIV